MPIDGTRKAKQLDGREILELWLQMGSLGRVSRYYRSAGYVNPDRMQPYHESSFWRAVSIYTVEHPTEAREVYIKAGDVKTDVEWEVFVLRRAIQVYKTQRSTFIRWVIHQEWPRKYEYLYQEEFQIAPEDYDYYSQLIRRQPNKGTDLSPVSE